MEEPKLNTPLFAALPVVIDTNVLVSILVFDDPVHQVLRDMWRNGRMIALTEPACLDELARVLLYPQFGLSAEEAAEKHAEYVRHAQIGNAVSKAITLPRCSDPDDQKFLELAHATQATSLITRDKALLKLMRRVPFHIETPETFISLRISSLPA